MFLLFVALLSRRVAVAVAVGALGVALRVLIRSFVHTHTHTHNRMVIAGTTARSLWVPLLPKNVSLIRFLFGVDTLVHQKRLWAGFSLFQNRIQHGLAYRYDGGTAPFVRNRNRSGWP